MLGGDSGSLVINDAQHLTKIFKEENGIRDLCYAIIFGKELAARAKIQLLLFTITVVLLASGLILGGFFMTKITVDGPARLASNNCGLWLFEGEKRSEAATRARMLDLEKEERAAQFAEDCYGQSSSAASRCKVLYRPTLPVSKGIYTNDCPFSQDVCRLNQTITFKTPIIDARDLGINSPSTPGFRRSTACTPLSMNYPYIQNKTVNGTTTFTYHYGQKYSDGNPVNYTYLTVGNPWDRLAPIYDVFAYSSNADESDHPVWIPHPDLTHPQYSTVTIVFISSLRILYEDNSNDPIFPADEEYHLPGDPKAWFRNSDPRARPLACVNTIDVCTADGRTCWNFNEPTSNSTTPDDTPDFVLLYSSLYKTDIYYSLAKRQGRSLLAQKSVSQYFSAALGDDHWVAEVQNWVWTALARTSINTWSVASGEDSVHEGQDGFTEVTKNYGNLCGRYKYNPQGYQSLHFWPLMLVVLWLPFIWLLSRKGRLIEQSFKTPLESFVRNVEKTLQNLKDYGEDLWQGSGDGAASQSSPDPPDTINLPIASSSDEATTAQQQSATPEEEQSTAVTIQPDQITRSSDTRTTTVQALTAVDSETFDEDRLEWERLIWHQLVYCLWFMISRFVLLVGLSLWVLWGLAWRGILSARDRPDSRGASVAATPHH